MPSILVVDAHPSSRGFLAWLLAQHGYRVLEADQDDAALSLCRDGYPDLLLIDLLCPSEGGHRLVQRLRESGDCPPAVFRVPQYAEEECRALAAACGVPHVVPADAAPGQVLAVLEAAQAASPPPDTEWRDDALCARLFPIIQAQERHIASLEVANIRWEQQVAESALQLEEAKEALAGEVNKRLWSERELLRRNQLLQAQAVRDPLTGLYNRRYLEESLEREESRAKRSGRPLGIMVMDIDHFKRWNDSHGHAAGDAILRSVSRLMESLARSEDILCRYGGEEFVLAMGNTSLDALRQRAENLRVGVQQMRIEHEGRILGPVTLSIGIALFPDAGTSAGEVLQAADVALYQAKGAGRNRVMAGERRRAEKQV